MKRRILLVVGFILITCSFNACELLSGNCETCQWVEYDNGVRTNEGDPIEYCDEDLLLYKNTPPVTVGSITTRVECW